MRLPASWLTAQPCTIVLPPARIASSPSPPRGAAPHLRCPPLLHHTQSYQRRSLLPLPSSPSWPHARPLRCTSYVARTAPLLSFALPRGLLLPPCSLLPHRRCFTLGAAVLLPTNSPRSSLRPPRTFILQQPLSPNATPATPLSLRTSNSAYSLLALGPSSCLSLTQPRSRYLLSPHCHSLPSSLSSPPSQPQPRITCTPFIYLFIFLSLLYYFQPPPHLAQALLHLLPSSSTPSPPYTPSSAPVTTTTRLLFLPAPYFSPATHNSSLNLTPLTHTI